MAMLRESPFNFMCGLFDMQRGKTKAVPIRRSRVFAALEHRQDYL